MAGVKGKSGGARSGSGGFRPGAGRKPKVVEAMPPATADGPLEFLLGVMNDLEQEPSLRVRAAIAAVQYTNRKIGESGKKDERQAAAEKASGGKFGMRQPPRLVANNG